MSCNVEDITKVAGLTILAETLLIGFCICCYYTSKSIKSFCCFI